MVKINFDNLPEVVNEGFYPLLWDEHELEVLVGGANSGKCFGKGTTVIMYSGEVKKVEEVMEGDLLMGVDFKPRKVLGTTKGIGELYKVEQNRGDTYIVNKEHILCLKNVLSNEFVEISIKDYLNKGIIWKTIHYGYKVYVPMLCKKIYKDRIDTPISVIKIGIGEYYGFSVNNDHKFLLSDFTVTHNSYFIGQKIIFKTLAEEGHRYLVCRKVKKDVRHSCYDLLKATIRNMGFDDLFSYNDTETIIKCKLNNNDIIGVGLDDVNKLKSFFDPTDYWLEEADQSIDDDVKQLNLRLRGGTTFKKQGILTMNPIWEGHWIKKKYFDEKVKGAITHHSTYKGNRFLDADTKRKMSEITDPYYKTVYADGLWGVYGQRVFTNYVIEDFDYKEDDLENVFTGMDFGFNHASAIERGGFRDEDIYIFDELYGKGWTNATFIQAAKDYWGEDMYYFRIIADSAEPDRIKEWQEQGYKVEGAIKGPGSLKFGIDYLCSRTIHIHKTKCPNLAKEFPVFHRKKDRFGMETEEFEEINDDGISCLRFGTEPIWHDGMSMGTVGDYGGYDVLGYLGL